MIRSDTDSLQIAVAMLIRFGEISNRLRRDVDDDQLRKLQYKC